MADGAPGAGAGQKTQRPSSGPWRPRAHLVIVFILLIPGRWTLQPACTALVTKAQSGSWKCVCTEHGKQHSGPEWQEKGLERDDLGSRHGER